MTYFIIYAPYITQLNVYTFISYISIFIWHLHLFLNFSNILILFKEEYM